MARPPINRNPYVEVRGIEELRQNLSYLQQEQFPFALKNTINRLSEETLPKLQERMKLDLHKPTDFTLNSLRIEYASKTKLSGRIWFKDQARLSASQHYLWPNVEGVRRGFKPFEGALYAKGLIPAGHFAAPGLGVAIDDYGNVPAGLQRQILAWFEANPERRGSSQNMTDSTRARRRRGTRNQAGYEFFNVKTRAAGRGLHPGIWYRQFDDILGNTIKCMFAYIPMTHFQYGKKYKFRETGEAYINDNLRPIFNQEMEAAIRTAFNR